MSDKIIYLYDCRTILDKKCPFLESYMNSNKPKYTCAILQDRNKIKMNKGIIDYRLTAWLFKKCPLKDTNGRESEVLVESIYVDTEKGIKDLLKDEPTNE